MTFCPVTTGPAKRLSPSFLQASFKYWKAATRSSRTLLFYRLNSPNSPSVSSQQRFSSPQIISVASSDPAPTGPCLSCAEGSRAGCRTPGTTSWSSRHIWHYGAGNATLVFLQNKHMSRRHLSLYWP